MNDKPWHHWQDCPQEDAEIVYEDYLVRITHSSCCNIRTAHQKHERIWGWLGKWWGMRKLEKVFNEKKIQWWKATEY